MQAYFDLDIKPIQDACKKAGIRHERLRINDFDPFHLRQRLPHVIKDMYAAHQAAGGTVYVHCTAGAPAAPACKALVPTPSCSCPQTLP